MQDAIAFILIDRIPGLNIIYTYTPAQVIKKLLPSCWVIMDVNHVINAVVHMSSVNGGHFISLHASGFLLIISGALELLSLTIYINCEVRVIMSSLYFISGKSNQQNY